MTDEPNVFMSSWISSTGLLFVTFLLLAVGAIWFVVLAVNTKSEFLAWTIGAYGGLFSILVWWMGGQLWSSVPLLKFAANGISARVLNGQTIAWKDIAEVCFKCSSKRFGVYYLVIHLKPHSERCYKHSFFYTGMNPSKFVISLSALRVSDLNCVREAAKEACIRYNNKICKQVS